MTRKLAIALIALISAVAARAQDFDDDVFIPAESHWMVSLAMGGNSTGYEADVACSWWPVENFGFKAALGIAGEIDGLTYDDWWDDNYDDFDDYVDHAQRFKFMPSVEMRSPGIFKWGEANSLRIFANPGCCLSPGASGSHDVKWFNWQIRGGVECDLGPIVLQGGYGLSDFNLYSGNPYCYDGDVHDGAAKTHSIFINIGIRF